MAEKTDITKEPSFLEHYKASLTIANWLSVTIGLLIFVILFGIAEAIKGYELSAWWPVIITAIVAPFLKDILKKLLLKSLFKGG